MAKFKDQNLAICEADNKGNKINKIYMVVYNHKTNIFTVRCKGKYSVDEELIYYSS